MTQSIWGKIGGAGIGFVLGGPIGALLGAFAGHILFDSDSAILSPAPSDVVFTTGLIALAAKMAKADGVVLQVEINAFYTVVDVSPSDRRSVENFFRIAQASTDGYEAYASQLAQILADEPTLLEDILDGLFYIAKADDNLHPAELAYLRRVAQCFGFSNAAFARIAARHRFYPDYKEAPRYEEARQHQRHAPHRDTSANDPYVVLGLDRNMPNDELKRSYRRLVMENHPDKAVAHGLPKEAIRIATERLAAINAAWDRISSERGIK